MTQSAEVLLDIELPDIDHLVTEDDTPVDNLPSEKQQRLLTEPLYSSWSGPGDERPFLAAANVGIFSMVRIPPVVPDMFLSLDVEVAEDWWSKPHRSYFLWEFGKPPDLVLEIVSNREGGEAEYKKLRYARMRVSYYVIYDPLRQVMSEVLTAFHFNGADFEPYPAHFPLLRLGLTLWKGEYEGKQDTWLRWVDADGILIPTGKERAEQEWQRAEHEKQRAEQESLRADQEEQKAEQASQRAEQERQRAEDQHRRALDAERQLEEERRKLERLMALLQQSGIQAEM